MDIVFIQGLTATTEIGVYEHERGIRQTLVIDLEMGCDTRLAGKTDAFEDALDYDAISRRTLAFVEQSSYYLLEAVAEQLAQVLFDEFRIARLKIKITKPGAVDIADAVGVVIERARPD